jgi:hypothetical protein
MARGASCSFCRVTATTVDARANVPMNSVASTSRSGWGVRSSAEIGSGVAGRNS